MSFLVGVDVGGTFTDLIGLDSSGSGLKVAKVPSTPPAFVKGVIQALGKAGLRPADIQLLVHGTTIASNAVLQRTGAKAGLIVTRGFRGVLEGARATRGEMFDLLWDVPRPLIPRRHILEISERVDAEGNVVEPLSEAQVRKAAQVFRRRGMEAIAICFMNSFMNPDHEERALAIVREECPEVFTYNSWQSNPQIHEFERTSTVVMNAYLGPIVDRYIRELSRQLEGWGYGYAPLIAHSGGGVTSPEYAVVTPARICESGPACAVIAGAYIGQAIGVPNLMCLDVGGTTAKWGLIYQGKPSFTPELSIEFNMVLRYPSIDVSSVGQGGGSIAWIDKGGALRVGPLSAGAVPGPVCYDAGGKDPTITDAQLALGRLNPATFLGGEMAIRQDLALKAVEERIGQPFGMKTEKAAEAVIQIALSSLATTGRVVSLKRGYDPRDFALVAFGGAGPLLAVELARQLAMPTVIVPRFPGITSALGLIQADFRHDLSRPILEVIDGCNLTKLNRCYREMEEEGREVLKKQGIAEGQVQLQRLIDVRYYLKYGVYATFPVTQGELARQDLEEIVHRYLQWYKDDCGYIIDPSVAPIEVVNARVVAQGLIPRPPFSRSAQRGEAREAWRGTRGVYFGEEGSFITTDIYDRARLPVGATFQGPAIVEQSDSTTVIPPLARARVDEFLNLIIQV